MIMRKSVRHPGVCGGAPVIDGTRLTCANVVLALEANGGDVERYLRLYPHLTIEDILACLKYCSEQRCLVDNSVRYCFRCSLDRSSSPSPPDGFLGSIDHLSKGAAGGQFFLGTAEESVQDMAPRDLWKPAEEFRSRIGR